jgi:hypothetical protein
VSGESRKEQAMTQAKDRTESAKDQESMAGSKRPDDGQELDAEIVRDLEVDEQASDVRGGPCSHSNPVAGF